MERELIIERLRGRESGASSDRGDHNLNTGLDDHDELIPAAVLVPLVERKNGFTTLLTQRTNHLAHHPGQVSFPGGHVDPSDESPEATALRETKEEIGLHQRHIDVLGRLDQYRVRTGFSVTPVVGLVTPPFDIKPDDFEVAEVFEVPLSFLMDPSNHERHSRNYRGKTRHFYAMPYNGYYIWGATAGMLVNLYQVLTEP